MSITAAQLSQDLQAAVLEQFGPGDQPAEVFPSKYFNYDVKSIDPAGGQTQRAPKYCATNLGATALASLFSTDGPDNGGYVAWDIVLGNAMVFEGLGGSFSDTQLVPWLVFQSKGGKSSKPVNAGTLLDYFNHGLPPAQALTNSQFEVKGAF